MYIMQLCWEREVKSVAKRSRSQSEAGREAKPVAKRSRSRSEAGRKVKPVAK